MALQISTALRNHGLAYGSIKAALMGGSIELRSGSQPANADAAATGTLLCTISDNAGALTNEVLATGTITITGSSGSISAITVNSIGILDTTVPYNTSTTQTATDLADAINASSTQPEYKATASSNVVTITAMPGTGTTPNGYVVAGTATTLSLAYANMAGGVNAVNGLKLASAASGIIAKRTSQVWSGASVATGTVGWFRFKGAVADGGALDSAATYFRIDGSVATSGGNLTMSNPTISAVGAIQTFNSFTLTLPAA